MLETNLSVYRGDKKTWVLTIKDSEGQAFDLTDYTVTMTVKLNASDTDEDALIQKDAVLTSPAAGICEIRLFHVDTEQDPRQYLYDVQIYEGDNIFTPLKGTFEIIQDITRKIS